MWLEPEMKIHAPEIGRAWYNTPPLAMRELRGEGVLVDFWDYTCSNCLGTLPYLKELMSWLMFGLAGARS